jgi:hypothetical protein
MKTTLMATTFLKAMAGHILGKGVLVGRFHR